MPLTMNQKPAQSGSGQQPAADLGEGRKTAHQKYPALPEGAIVDAQIVRCQIRQAPYWVDYDNEVSFAFKVTDGPFRGQWLFAQTEAVLEDDPTCTLTEWVKTILGLSSLPDDYEFIESDFVDEDDPIQVRVQVRQYYSKKKDEFKNEVVAILPTHSGPNSAEEVFGA